MAGVPLSHTKSVYFPTAVKLSRGRQQQEEEEEVVDIACGHFHALAVTAKQEVYGWGMNEHFQLLQEHDSNVETPLLLNPTLPFLSRKPFPRIMRMAGSGVASGMLVKPEGEVELWTWGSSLYSLAHAPQFPRKRAAFPPSKVLGLEHEEISDFALGWGHGLALTSDKRLYVWGWGQNGQLGLGDYDNRPLPKLLDRFAYVPIHSLAVGPDCSIAVTEEGELYFWGRNEYWMKIKVEWTKGNETKGENVPMKVSFPEKARIVEARSGYGHLVALDENGGVWTWGLNKDGQLGLGDNLDRQGPQKVEFFEKENLKVVQVRCGRVHTVFLTEDGRLWTCGSGIHGRLGHGDRDSQLLPTHVDSLGQVTKVECGYDFTLALVRG